MILIAIALIAQAALDNLPAARDLPASAPEEQAVLRAANGLLAAFNTGDPAEILSRVYPDGRVTGTGTFPNRSGVRSESWTQFTQRAAGSGFQETISNPTIEVHGDVAMVWAPFVVRIGGRVYNCGIDHFDLVRENGAWKTLNLTFWSRISGCPTQ